jgi:peptide/nickel transport system substrate-binding protein
MSLVYNGLVNLTADWNDVEPALAEKWNISPDGLTYTFFLRQNVKWHDGKPFTAADVEFTYKTILTKALGSIYAKNVNMIKGAQNFYDGKTTALEGLKVVNEYQVEITLERPTAPFLLNTLTETCIIPKHVWSEVPAETLAKPATWEKNQIGTGPFKWSKFENDKFVELVRYDDYFRGKPNIEKVLMVKVGTTPEATAVALEKGELDYTTVPATEIDRMNKLGHLTIYTKPVYNLRFLSINVNKPYFKDKRVRQAVAYGVDRVGLCEAVLLKVCEPWNSISVTKVWYNTELPKYPYDPAKAQALLKEAGWDANREIELSLYYNDQLSKDYIAAVQQQLAKIGMKAKVVQLDGPGVTPYYYQDKKFDIMYAGFGVAPDMDVFRGTFHSEATYPSGQNAMLYSNPRIDELFTKGQTAQTQAERKKIYDEVQTILADELPWVPLHLLRIVAGFNKRVQNGEAIANVWNRPYNWQIEKTWLSDGK